MFQRLIEYKKHVGNTKVPKQYDQDPKLGEWVATQRQAYKIANFPKERASLLNSIGFDWGVSSPSSWDVIYKRLAAYMKEHGDAKVPHKYDQDIQLGQWIIRQRHAYKKKKISSEHASLLNSIGFDWGARAKNWDQMYQQLIVYKNNHNGNVNVPARHDQLGQWVHTQRVAYKKKKMSKERVTLLNSIGFSWKGLGRYIT